MTKAEKDKVYNTKGLAPNISMPVKGNASSTTTSAIAEGTIDIRENPTQDISALSRNTENALNELGRIFDKKKIEEQQELAAVFGEEAFRLAHNMKDDGSGRKIAVHAIIGGIMSQITGAGFASGAVGAGLNEALINAVKGKDPGTAQIVSAIIGAAAAKVAGGSAAAGASAAATGTKWNAFLLKYPNHNGVGALALHILKREDGKELSPEEAWSLVQGVNNVFSEAEPIRANAQNIQAENVQNYPKAISYLMNSGITKESAIQFFKEYNTIVRGQNWNGFSFINDVHVGIDENQNPIEKIRMPKFELKKEYILEPYPPGVFTGENLVLPDTPKQGTESNNSSFDVLKSTVTNILSDTANRVPEAIKNEGYYRGFLSGYIKAGGVVTGTLTLIDIKKDLNTYNDGKLVVALGTDILPLFLAAGGTAVGVAIGSEAGLSALTGAWGGIGGAILGDFLKHEIRHYILQEK